MIKATSSAVTMGTALMAALAAFALSGAANAQTPRTDAEYCASLIEIYERYISNPLGPRNLAKTVDLEGRVAVAQCQQGDTASGIPVLEQRLRINKFTLPPRG